MATELQPYIPTPKPECWCICWEQVSQRALLHPDSVIAVAGISGDWEAVVSTIENMGGTLEDLPIFNAQGQEISDIRRVCACLPASFDKEGDSTLNITNPNSLFTVEYKSRWTPCRCKDHDYEFKDGKIKLDVFNYNNDKRGCGSLQHPVLNITNFGEYSLDSMICNGVNVIATPIVNSYGNWNDNFDFWTGQGAYSNGFNQLTNHTWGWINYGRPCARVMSVMVCDGTIYGDFRLTPIDVRPNVNGIQALIQPEHLTTGELPVTICRRKGSDGIEQVCFGVDGQEITDMAAYIESQAGHVVDPTTGVSPFTARNIAKFFTVEQLKQCVQCDTFVYPEIPVSIPECQTQIFPGCEISEAVIDEESGEVAIPAQVVTQGLFTAFTICDGNLTVSAYAESEDGDLIDHELGEGNYYGDCDTLAAIAPEPQECDPNAQFLPYQIQKTATYVDNTNWSGMTQLHYNNAIEADIEVCLEDGRTHVEPFVAGVSSYIQMRNAMQNAGACSVKVAVANHPNGSPDNLANVPAYANQNPDSNELLATGWVTEWCKSNPMKRISIKTVITGDQANAGAFRPLTYYDGPVVEIQVASTCLGMFYRDCDGKDIVKPDCKPRPISDAAQQSCLEKIKCLLECPPDLDVGAPTFTVGQSASGGLVQFPLQAGQIGGPEDEGFTDDFMIPVSLPEHECLTDPDATVIVRYCFDHEVTPSTVHIGFNVSPVGGVGTLIETSNGNGAIGTPNIGPPLPRTQTVRTKQWADFQYTVAELQAGQAIQTSAFGTTNAGLETLHSVTAELITDLGCC